MTDASKFAKPAWLAGHLRVPGLMLMVWTGWALPGATTSSHAQGFPTEAHSYWQQKQLILSVQGKGSCLAYDVGVLAATYEHVPALRRGEFILTGNSSGSILATYFACHGFSDATMANMQKQVLEGNKDAVRNMENPHSKLAKIARSQPLEISHEVLAEYIAFALGVPIQGPATSLHSIIERSTARVQHPLLIAAINREVLADRDPDELLRGWGLKEIDLDTMDVFWKPAVYEYYRQHPERFAREHPQLRLGETRLIGKAVTFFVDRSLFELLRTIPADELQADLRLIETPADLALAIQATVSEPTYFDPIDEPQPSAVWSGGQVGTGNSLRRTYYGGYLSPLPVQDIRRMLPQTYVMGTGFRHHPLIATKLLRSWLLADVEKSTQRSEWWADLEVLPSAEFAQHMIVRDLSSHQEFEFGYRRALQVFAEPQLGLPRYVEPPKYRAAAAGAIASTDHPSDTAELQTGRGLQPLLIRPASDQSTAP